MISNHILGLQNNLSYILTQLNFDKIYESEVFSEAFYDKCLTMSEENNVIYVVNNNQTYIIKYDEDYPLHQ